MKLDMVKIIKRNRKRIIISITLLFLLICFRIIFNISDDYSFYECINAIFNISDDYSFCSWIIAIFLIASVMENYSEITKLKKLSAYIDYQEFQKILLYKRNTILLSDKYIVNLESNPKIYNYNDIIFLFKRTELGGGFKKTISDYLYLYLSFGEKNKIPVNSTTINVDYIIKIIKEKNPNVLVGKTKENKKILLEKYGIKL